MPVSIDIRVKEQVLKQWINGDSRDKIAADNHIGAGTVTNVIAEWKKRLDDPEFDSVRDFTVSLKKQGISFSELASWARLYNFVKKLGADEHQIESLLSNLLDGSTSLSNDKIIDLVNQLYETSKSESIPPTEVPIYVKQKLEEKKKLEEEIQKAGAILEDKKIDIQTIEAYKKLEEELKKHGLPMKALSTLLSVLQTINQMGHDPRKIVSALSRIKSFKETERGLKRECKVLEMQSAQYKEVLPTCQQIARLGIGFPELTMFYSAITKRADMENLPPGRAAYRVMQDIENYNKLSDMKTQLYNIVMQINIMKNISARQNDAMIALAKLQLYGISESQILDLCRTIEANGHNPSGQRSMNSPTFPVF